MKKSIYILTSITLVFVGLIVGVFIGRSFAGTRITIVPLSANNVSSDVTEQEDSERGKVNINTAGKNDLTLLPGVGSIYAEKIIQFREDFGRFTCIEDLIYVDGFSYTRIEQLRPYITVGG